MSGTNAQDWASSWMESQKALMAALFPALPKGDAPAQSAGPLQEQFSELQQTWQDSIAKWTEHAKQQGLGKPLTPQALKDLFSPAQWSGTGAGTFDAGLRHVLEGPKYATLFDMDRQLLELQQLAARRDKDAAAFQAVVAKAWNTAFKRFSAVALKEAPAGVSWRGLADRWLATVNETLIESQRSDEFVQAQSRMLRSASDYRLQERKIAEAWCESMHIPTRTEVDELQRTVTELRRQVRALQRAGADDVPAPAPKASAPRKAKPRTSARPKSKSTSRT